MADDPELPFSALNQQPGVSGLQDISLPFDDLLNGIQSIQDVIFSLDDLKTALDGDLGEAFKDATPIDEIAGAILGDPSSDIDSKLSRVVGRLETKIRNEGQLTQDAVEEAEQEILDALAGEIDDISVVVEGIDIDEDEIADEIEDELDIPGDGGTVINFDSVFGAVASTIEDSFQLALDSVIGDPTTLPGDIDTVVGALAALLDQIGQQPELPDIPSSGEISTVVARQLTELPGGEILGAPDQFVDSQIDRVTDGLVDDSAVATLEQSIQEAP
jgi:hypothetical protein